MLAKSARTNHTCLTSMRYPSRPHTVPLVPFHYGPRVMRNSGLSFNNRWRNPPRQRFKNRVSRVDAPKWPTTQFNCGPSTRDKLSFMNALIANTTGPSTTKGMVGSHSTMVSNATGATFYSSTSWWWGAHCFDKAGNTIFHSLPLMCKRDIRDYWLG